MVKFVAGVAMVDPTFYVPIAQAAEEAGFDSVAVPDSICYPAESDATYPYNEDGTREFLENKPFIEPLIAMAAMAAATTRIVFHTAVLKLPIRHPVIFAKELTSVAVLSGNRVRLGVGTSPWPEDYEAVELTWQGRGRRMDECIKVIRGLSTGDYFEFAGEHYRIPSIRLNPVPTEPVPILIGGHGETGLRRAARLGDGWISAGSSTEELMARLALIDEYRRDYGREDVPFEVHATTEDSFTPDGIARLEELGVTHTNGGFGRFNPYGSEPDPESLQEKIDNLRRFADAFIT